MPPLSKVCSQSVLNKQHKKSNRPGRKSERIGKTWSFPECNFTLLFPGELARSRGGSAGDVTKDVDDCSPFKELGGSSSTAEGGTEIEFIYSFASLEFLFIFLAPQ